MTHRRQFAAGLAALMLPPTAAGAAPNAIAEINAAAAANPVTVHPVRANISMLDGSGGEITVLSGPGGLLLVDAGIAVSQAKIEAALRTINPGKIRYVITTHWHWDHADGNGWVRRTGATVMADKATVARLGQAVYIPDWDVTFQAVPEAARPNEVLTGDKTLRFAGETVLIRHYRPSHTDGDLSVYFRKADVLATGDTFWNGIYPFIDYVAGGSIDGAIAAANLNLSLAKSTTRVVPGHGPLGDRAQLVAYRDMLVTVRDRVAALKAKGLTADEVVAAKPTASFDPVWGGAVISGEVFTRLVYRGV